MTTPTLAAPGPAPAAPTTATREASTDIGTRPPAAGASGLRPWARITLAALSLGAAAIHAVLAPAHAEEWAVLGAGFWLAAAFQVAAAVVVLARPSRRTLLAVAAGNVVILAAWAASRTTGLPVGPDAGVREAVHALDVVCATFEVLLATGAVTAALRPRVARRSVASRWLLPAVAAASVLGVGVSTGTALAQPEAISGCGPAPVDRPVGPPVEVADHHGHTQGGPTTTAVVPTHDGDTAADDGEVHPPLVTVHHVGDLLGTGPAWGH